MSPLRPVVIVLGLVAVLLGLPHLIAPVSAATVGAGIHGITPAGGFLGNHIAPDGSRVYCVDSDRDWPDGSTGAGTVVSTLTTDGGVRLTASVLQRLDLALARYGQTADPVQAAAVNAYVYAWTSWYADRHGAGREAGLHYINGHAAVERVFTSIWRETEAAVTRSAPTASVDITMTDAVTGVVTVVSSHEGAGEVTLSGAVGTESGLTTVPITGSVEIPITGVPPAGTSEYLISAEVSLRTSARHAASVRLYATGDQQRTIRDAGSRPQDIVAAAQLGPIALPFRPVLTSRVADALAEPGSPLIDTLAVGLQGDTPWPERAGAPVPVLAHGTLYGPFEATPQTTDAPPAGAPIAATETLTLAGPGEYRTTGAVTVSEPGHYTWVWRIEAGSQEAEVQALLPADYVFADRFGLPDETVEVVAPQLAATGAAPAPLAAPLVLVAVGVLLGNIARRRVLPSV